jgi:N-dimethylarginine dimethylaminohydrolase
MDSAQTNSPLINQTVLMSGADYFGDDDAINDLMDAKVPVDVAKARAEHSLIKSSLEQAGVTVRTVAPPADCQDGVYTANWALVRGRRALMSRLPKQRQPEEAYAREVVKKQGLTPVILPTEVARFSGQGDALPCGDVLFTQSPYRTTLDAHAHIKELLGFREVISLRTKPARIFVYGPARVNRLTGLPDSPTYDIDLALAVLKFPGHGQKGLIAYCPAVFERASRRLLRGRDDFDKIEVSRRECLKAFALNLVSTGQTVVMNAGAPRFQAALEAHGLKTVALDLPELKKGGGSIRCSTLTLDN